jgi:hypothetical protein
MPTTHLPTCGRKAFDMLANGTPEPVQSGTLQAGLLPLTSILSILDFIAAELPRWRDRPGRRKVTAETPLTSQLAAHLNSATRHAGWDWLQFRPGEPDTHADGRLIDLVAAPRGCEIEVEGRLHADFDTLLPIECKRLPTPRSKRRDKREYVASEKSSMGGIQRFKAGHHGGDFGVGAMIGYIQAEITPIWYKRIDRWIGRRVRRKVFNWTHKDRLRDVNHDRIARTARVQSLHSRERGLPDITLHHVWIEM